MTAEAEASNWDGCHLVPDRCQTPSSKFGIKIVWVESALLPAWRCSEHGLHLLNQMKLHIIDKIGQIQIHCGKTT